MAKHQNNHIDQEPLVEPSVRIEVKEYPRDQIRRMRHALSFKEGENYRIIDINTRLLLEGLKALEQQYNLAG
jgi:hypothetical protein